MELYFYSKSDECYRKYLPMFSCPKEKLRGIPFPGGNSSSRPMKMAAYDQHSYDTNNLTTENKCILFMLAVDVSAQPSPYSFAPSALASAAA
jgi:hypothetical protein